MRVIGFLILALIAFTIIALSALNAHTVVLNYYLGALELPMALLLIAFFVIGVGCAGLFFLKQFIFFKLKIYQLQKIKNKIK